MPSLDYEATLYNLLLHAIDEELGRLTGSPLPPAGRLYPYLDGFAALYLATRAESPDLDKMLGPANGLALQREVLRLHLDLLTAWLAQHAATIREDIAQTQQAYHAQRGQDPVAARALIRALPDRIGQAVTARANEYLDRFRALVEGCDSVLEQAFVCGLFAYGPPDLPWAALCDPQTLRGQVAAGPYRLDFALTGHRGPVALEVDGHTYHERTPDQAAHDRRRDRELSQQGWTVLRFHRKEIDEDLPGCVAHVVAAYTGRPVPVAEPVPAPTGATAGPSCPRCHAPMVLRTAARGTNKGGQFYGCSTYPKCRGMVRAPMEAAGARP
jgi:restriction system protein